MTVALRKMEIQRNGNKKHGVVRFTEVIIMSGNNNQKSAGYAILGVIIVFAIIGFFVSLTEKEDPKCAFAGCDNTVSTALTDGIKVILLFIPFRLQYLRERMK